MATSESFEQLAQELVASGSPDEIIAAVPVGSQLIIKHIAVVNPSVADCWIKIWTGTGTADANLLLPEVSIDAGGWAEFDGSITLDTGKGMSAQAQTNDVLTITVYGLELVTT